MTHEEESERIKYGLELAYRRMLEEKALYNEDIIVSSDGINIERIPAKQVLSELPPLPEPPDCLKGQDLSDFYKRRIY